MVKELIRMWINQPSTHHALHRLHGTNVLAQHEYDDTVRVYFLSGDVVSQQVSKAALSRGWQVAATQATPSQRDVPVHVSEQAEQAYRAEFAALVDNKHLDMSTKSDAWGRPVFLHEHIESRFKGWLIARHELSQLEAA